MSDGAALVAGLGIVVGLMLLAAGNAIGLLVVIGAAIVGGIVG